MPLPARVTIKAIGVKSRTYDLHVYRLITATTLKASREATLTQQRFKQARTWEDFNLTSIWYTPHGRYDNDANLTVVIEGIVAAPIFNTPVDGSMTFTKSCKETCIVDGAAVCYLHSLFHNY